MYEFIVRPCILAFGSRVTCIVWTNFTGCFALRAEVLVFQCVIMFGLLLFFCFSIKRTFLNSETVLYRSGVDINLHNSRQSFHTVTLGYFSIYYTKKIEYVCMFVCLFVCVFVCP